MISRQTIDVAESVGARSDGFQNREQRLPTPIVEIDGLASITPRGQLVEGSRVGEPSRSAGCSQKLMMQDLTPFSLLDSVSLREILFPGRSSRPCTEYAVEELSLLQLRLRR